MSPSAARTGAGLNQKGFVLFATLLVMVFVSGLSLDHALRARAERQQAWNGVTDLRARAAARAGVSHAVARLRTLQGSAVTLNGMASPDLYTWNRLGLLSGEIATVPLGGGVFYDVRVWDASSRLPLNYASEEELRQLFLALGVEFDQADVAAQSILDWRDPDDLHRARGAEWSDHYQNQPSPVTPRNGAFVSLGELRLVRGMGELYPRVAEHLTLAGDGYVNLNTANEPVLRALPGFSDELVALVLYRRRTGNPFRDWAELEAGLSAPARAVLQENLAALVRRASFEPRVFEITARGWTHSAPLLRTVHAVAVRSGSSIQVVRSIQR